MATDTAAVLPFLAPTTVEGTAEAVPLDAASRWGQGLVACAKRNGRSVCSRA